MRLITEFNKFKPQYRPIRLNIRDEENTYVINFDESKTEEKEVLIKSIIKGLFPDVQKKETMLVGGKVLSSELLRKAQKNLKILYVISHIMLSLGEQLNSADDIINFIKNNSSNLFSADGIYFDDVYNALKGVSESGVMREQEATTLFKKYALSKGFNVEILPPDSTEDDIKGVDAYFKIDEIPYTIQIKTLDSIELVDDFYHVYISGDFTKIKTHYLVLVPNPDKKTLLDASYIFRGSNIKTEFDKDNRSYYLIPSLSLLYSDKSETTLSESRKYIHNYGKSFRNFWHS